MLSSYRSSSFRAGSSSYSSFRSSSGRYGRSSYTSDYTARYSEGRPRPTYDDTWFKYRRYATDDTVIRDDGELHISTATSCSDISPSINAIFQGASESLSA